MRRLVLLLSATAALSACPGRCRESVERRPSWGECKAPLLRDEAGGSLLLRGANVSAEAKWRRDRLPPYERADLAWLRDELGLNAIRLLVFWEALEPYPGLYDPAYLDAVRSFVEMSGQEDLLVVVDMHQDIYGRGFGEAGAPWWSCDAGNYETFEAREPWFLGYLETEVGACFDTLYEEGPTRAAFVSAWGRLAEELASTDAVLAYDLLNEPFWGSTSAAEFEEALLPGFYGELIDTIRMADPIPWILVEPAPTANVGVHSDLAPVERSRLIYGPHYYPAPIELGEGYDGHAGNLRDQVSVLCADARRLEAPLVVGEVGVRRSVPGAISYLADVYAIFDAGQVGAFYFSLERGGPKSYGLLNPDGSPSTQAKAVARPYPRRVAGVLHLFRWNPVTGVFLAEWNEDGSAGGETTFAVPRLAFPDGIHVSLDGAEVTASEGDSEPEAPLLPYRLERRLLHVPQEGGIRRITLRRKGDTELAQAPTSAPDAGATPTR